MPESSSSESASPRTLCVRSLSASSLPRGRACVDCRRRKIKCDGAKPVCGRCLRYNRAEDCEYVNEQGRCKSQILKEHIAYLEGRIYDLENPIPSVNLCDPVNLYLPVFGDTSTSSLPSPLTSGGAPSPTYASKAVEDAQKSFPFQVSESWLDSEDTPAHLVQPLIDKFIPHASEFGFFLNIPRFRHSALLPSSYYPHSRPCPALLSVVCLWGIRLFASEQLAALENIFLFRTLKLTADTLSGDHPLKLTHAMQTEVLLCHYFFHSGQLLQGQYHANIAASVVVMGRLCKIRSSLPRSVGSVPSSYPRRDSIEEGELIRGFWSVVVLDACWAVALNTPPSVAICNRESIDTPWPLDMEAYEQGQCSPDSPSRDIYERISEDLQGVPEDAPSVAATHTKAAILLGRANELAKEWNPEMSADKNKAYLHSFTSVNDVIEMFRDSLLPFGHISATTPAATRVLIVAHSLAHLAAIKLNSVFAQVCALSRQICLSAAWAVVTITEAIDPAQVMFINPIIGSVWTAAAQVFINEIAIQRAMSALPTLEFAVTSEENLLSALRMLLSIMGAFGPGSSLMQYQLTKVQEAMLVI